MKTVLVLAANPIESVRFQFHHELSAIQKSKAFYDGVFAGRDYESAFRLGKTGIKSSFDDYKPHLFSRNEIQEPIDLEQPGSRMSIESKFYVMRSKLDGNPDLKVAFRRVLAAGSIDPAMSSALKSWRLPMLRSWWVEREGLFLRPSR